MVLCKFLLLASLFNCFIPDKPSTPSQTIGEKKKKTFPAVRTIFLAFVLLKNNRQELICTRNAFWLIQYKTGKFFSSTATRPNHRIIRSLFCRPFFAKWRQESRNKSMKSLSGVPNMRNAAAKVTKCAF